MWLWSLVTNSKNKMKLGCKHGQVHEDLQCTTLCNVYFLFKSLKFCPTGVQ